MLVQTWGSSISNSTRYKAVKRGSYAVNEAVGCTLNGKYYNFFFVVCIAKQGFSHDIKFYAISHVVV